nr:Vhc1 [Starmerella bombicola]
MPVKKLGTLEGVFVPTTLNVLSILIYLRFGFIVGQAGIVGSLLLLVISYTINLITTLSVSAIATNGIVQGGGAYFMISRSLGPEFGGSIGVVFYIGQVLNAGLNVAGFSDPLLAKFGERSGAFYRVLPESASYKFFYETILLLVCTLICLKGPQMFARSSKLLFQILLAATLAIPISTLVVKQFYNEEFQAWYTGPSWRTTRENWWPQYTKGAAGGNQHHKETFRNLFGIFFSATAGILAGASMSGDLKHPSKSIPKGTLWGLALTFALYASVIVSLGTSVSRDLLRRDVDVISSIDVSPALVMLGEFATSIFSALMGIIGAAYLLQAIAKDDVVPFIGRFKSGSGTDNNPRAAIIATYALTQLTILLDLNQIAVYITMAFLMTFVVINLACFLLDVAAAPNFRPSFIYFDANTALVGFIICIGAMLAADMIAALSILLLGILVFIVIHSYSAPKPWGDVSQSIIYHQVRKYLLLLKQDHVKYWRPQLLLMVDDPRSCWQLIRFCNYLKKGGLFVMGHVVTIENEFQADAAEVLKQRSAWEKLKSRHGMKAFFQICASSSLVWGVRNIYLGSGLGGMKPNITILGFYDEMQRGQQEELLDVEALPTDNLRKEKHLSLQEWVQCIEDLLALGSNVCIAKGFMNAELPPPAPIIKLPWKAKIISNEFGEGHIDLYPIQMSAKLMDSKGQNNGLSINFDTYTLILQLGSILHSVKAWSNTHDMRVIVFVENSNEVGRETARINELLETLRIKARVIVKALDTENEVYNIIVKGAEDVDQFVTKKLVDSQWWKKICEARSSENEDSVASTRQLAFVVPRVIGKKRRTLSSLQQLGVAHSMQSTRWLHSDLNKFYGSVTDGDSEEEHEGSDAEGYKDSNSESDSESESDTFSDRVGTSGTVPVSNDSGNSNGILLTRRRSLGGDEAGPCFQDDPMDASELGRGSRESYPVTSAGLGLQFNDLPARAQYLILNCLMRQVSKDASVIFSTLPAPALGTHAEETTAKKYHAGLKLLCEDLPPVALVHAQSMTVTTDL